MQKKRILRLLLIDAIALLLYSCSSTTATPRPLSTSSTGGTVAGVLLSDTPGKPPVGLPLYLGEILLSNATPVMASVDKQTAPKTLVESNGQFIFMDVPEGNYALIADMVNHAVVLHEPIKDQEIIVTVKKGEIIDLGTLKLPTSTSITTTP